MQWIAVLITWCAVGISLLALRNVRRGYKDLDAAKENFREGSERTLKIRERNMQLANIAVRMRDEIVVLETKEDGLQAGLRDPHDRGMRLARAARELDQIVDDINWEETHG